jgi:hypothetical protein
MVGVSGDHQAVFPVEAKIAKRPYQVMKAFLRDEPRNGKYVSTWRDAVPVQEVAGVGFFPDIDPVMNDI